MRVGFGPVFAFEWLMTSRRWQFYAARSLFVLVFLAGLYLVWKSEMEDRPYRSVIQRHAQIGESLFYAIVSIQLTLIMLAAPAATAGAVCLDKKRGSLLHVLVTDLSNAEIILGKLAARLIPVLGLVGCTLPFVFLSMLLGGIDPEALIGSFLITVAIAILGCALALCLSVWCRRTHEVLLVTYLVWVGMMLGNFAWGQLTKQWGFPSPPVWFADMNPYWMAFAPYFSPGSIRVGDYLHYLAGILVASLALVLLAIVSVRIVAVRQSAEPQQSGAGHWLFKHRRVRRWRLSGPSLDRNPALWREMRRGRPSRWVQFVWLVYIAGAGFFSFLAIDEVLHSKVLFPFMAAIVNPLQVSVGLLLVSIMSVAGLFEDRASRTLEVLFTTPVSTGSILAAKWWRSFRLVLWLMLLPLSVAVAKAYISDKWALLIPFALLIACYGAAITSVGLALSTWMGRIGRAIAVTVTIYVLACIGWVVVLFMLFRNSFGPQIEGIACGSPFFGTAVFTEILSPNRSNMPAYSPLPWAALWIIVYLLVAVCLYIATLVTFGRCLGRMAEGMGMMPARRPREEALLFLDKPAATSHAGALYLDRLQNGRLPLD